MIVVNNKIVTMEIIQYVIYWSNHLILVTKIIQKYLTLYILCYL